MIRVGFHFLRLLGIDRLFVVLYWKLARPPYRGTQSPPVNQYRYPSPTLAFHMTREDLAISMRSEVRFHSLVLLVRHSGLAVSVISKAAFLS